MAESDSGSDDDFVEAALRRVLEEKELAFRNAMPLDKPTALAEFKVALASFADYTMRRGVPPR